MFEYRFIRYNWDYEEHRFVPIKYDCELPFQVLRDKAQPSQILTQSERQLQRVIFGAADI